MTEQCLYIGGHTRSPKNPAKYRVWAERMKKTHVQTMCPGCNLWVVWKPKERDDVPTEVATDYL